MKHINFFYKILPSVLTFLSGVGAIYLVDILISRSANTDLIADWALLRSFLMIGMPFSLFGLEQVLIREPQKEKFILKILSVHIICASLLLGLIGFYFKFVPSLLFGFVIIFGVATFNLAFQWLRSHYAVMRAYFANSIWRVVFLVGTWLFMSKDGIDISNILLYSFIISWFLLFPLLLRVKPRINISSIHDDVKSIGGAYRLGSAYFISAISLAFSSYGESFVIHQLGSDIDVAGYFQSSVVFLSPGVMLNQYIGAFLGTFLRDNPEKSFSILIKYRKVGLFVLFLLFPLFLLTGYGLEFFLHGKFQTSIILASILTITSVMRVFYILPSSFVGVLAKKRELHTTTIIYLICALLLPLMAFIGVKLGFEIIFAVAFANFLNWSARSFVGFNLMLKWKPGSYKK